VPLYRDMSVCSRRRVRTRFAASLSPQRTYRTEICKKCSLKLNLQSLCRLNPLQRPMLRAGKQLFHLKSRHLSIEDSGSLELREVHSLAVTPGHLKSVR
jgi:hypothetical protein